MEKFILLAARRSGTTLLIKSFNSHPQIECHKKVFSTKRRLRYLQVDKPGSRFNEFRSASTGRQIDYIFRRRQLIDSFLTQVFAPADGVEAMGVRLAYSQADKYPEILAWALENDVGIIHLVRENSLKAIVSDFTARKRGVYHSTSKVKRITIQLSPRKLKRRLTGLMKRIEKYRAMFKGRRYCEVSYESFVVNRETETKRILDFLQIDQVVPLTTNLVKQNPDSLEDILENYEEIAQALKDTIFERYLVM